MKREDKGLLMKDLSARLLFGVKIKIGEYSDYKLIGVVITDEHQIKVEVIENEIPYKIEVSPDIIKPYLRSMSSMTEDDIIELSKIDEKRLIFSARHLTYCLDGEVIDYLNRKMFDYRGLIEKGLALEAPEGMY